MALFYDISGSERGFTTYPGRSVVLRHIWVGALFYDISGSERCFTTYLGRSAVLRHIWVGALFYDISGSEHCFTTYPVRSVELRHIQFGALFYDISSYERRNLIKISLEANNNKPISVIIVFPMVPLKLIYDTSKSETMHAINTKNSTTEKNNKAEL